MLETLRRLVQDIGDAPDLDGALALVVRWIREALAVDASAVYLVDPSDQHLVLMATEGLNPQAVGRVRLAPGEGVVGLVRKRREPVALEDALAHPSFRRFPGIGEARYRGFLGVPIVHYRKVLGVVVALNEGERAFDENDKACLITATAQLAGAIAESALSRPSSLDLRGQPGKPYLSGVAGAPGAAIGTLVAPSPLSRFSAVEDREAGDPALEEAAFRDAVTTVESELNKSGEMMRELLPSEALALFDVYALMVSDDSLVSRTVDRIRAGRWAPAALRDTIEELAATLDAVEDERLRARAEDIRAVGRRILVHLQSDQRAPREYPDRTVLYGDEVSLARMTDVPRERLAGVVCVKGSALSHTAVIARALGVPAIMGLGSAAKLDLDGHVVVVDGYRGRLFVDPERRIRDEFERVERAEHELNTELAALKDKAARTTDGVDVPLYVNTGLLTDIDYSLSVGALGVGLYRTEFPFMLRETFPSEEVQLEIYTQILEAFAPNPVVMRTLDIGGDKALPYFPIDEPNSLLGWRGIRIMLHHPEIFLTQIKAMLRAHRRVGNLRILLPMVSCLEEIKEAKSLLIRAMKSLRQEGVTVDRPALGVMLEVPAALFALREFAAEVDFFSIGTNDLTQYMMAVDRGNPRVAPLYDHLHPVMLRSLRFAVSKARELGKPISVCGELAGDAAGAVLLLGMDIDYLSMSASSLPRVKWAIRSLSRRSAVALLDEALARRSATQVRALVHRALEDAGAGGLLHAGR